MLWPSRSLRFSTIDSMVLRFCSESGSRTAGARIDYTVPGAGGYGDALTRSRDQVREDLRNGYVSAAAARDLYGLTDT